MGPLLPLIRACQIPTFDRDPLKPVERTSRGLTDHDFLFWVVSPADSLDSVKRDRLFELLDDLGFYRDSETSDLVDMGQGRKGLWPYSLYPLVGERLVASSDAGSVDMWVGFESASERATSSDPRKSTSAQFDLTGIVVSAAALNAGTSPLSDLWNSLPTIAKVLGGVYACGLSDGLSNITMNVAHHFERLLDGRMPPLAGVVVVVPESSQEMCEQLQRAATGTRARFELVDGFGTLWCSEFPLVLDESQWGPMIKWITDSQLRVKSGQPSRWPTSIGLTNVDPASLGLDDGLVDSLNSWGEVASEVDDERLKLDNCGFSSQESLEVFVADGRVAAQELADALDRQVSYSPLVARHQTIYPRGLTDQDFFFWIVSPLGHLSNEVTDSLFDCLDDLGFRSSVNGGDAIAIGHGRRRFSPYALYPPFGKKLVAWSGSEAVEIWVGFERSAEAEGFDDQIAAFDTAGIVIAAGALEADQMPARKLWESFPEIVRLLGGQFASGATQGSVRSGGTKDGYLDRIADGEVPFGGEVLVVPATSTAMVSRLEKVAGKHGGELIAEKGFMTLRSSNSRLELEDELRSRINRSFWRIPPER